jgi:TLC domain
MWSRLWFHYFNHEESILPFVLPGMFWIAAFAYAELKQFSFHKWYAIHNIHNFGAMILGLCSINSIFHERIPILWSSGYFIVDLFDCMRRHDVVYSLHAAFCLCLGVACYQSPLYVALHMNSKATFCELSNPFMHLAKKTRNPIHFIMFAVVFTFCRIFWLPYLFHQLHATGKIQPTDIRQLCLLFFYGLNWFWYVKIINIIYQAAVSKKKSSSPDDKKDD